ncbi:hypothetical protein FRX31_016193 [Thalictrum thalictroides]|uniref:Uncharacterized protein n=1 Tax=Thalictrum thalictroides TaxID=46969 RepID=A0A7J6W9Z0_THATH|nr:hypothetical protein FRX31_016193 [Thalictrum thalictroides]
MKFVAVLIVLMMVISSSFAIQRKALMDEKHGQDQRQPVVKGLQGEAPNKDTNAFGYSGNGVSNHHGIPRQYYNDWGSNPKGDGGNNDDNGTG